MTDVPTQSTRDRRHDPGRALAIPHAACRAVLIGMVGLLYVVFVAPFGPVRPAFRRTLERGRGVYRKVLDIQTRILLTLVFGLIILPMGLVMRFFGSSPLNQPRESPSSFWSTHEDEELSVDRYRRMF